LAAVAEALQGCGFEILRVGRFGVTVEAEPEQFLKVFGVQVKPGEATALEVKPTIDPLAGLVDLVEITPTAELF
jgi:hypothetical protein